MKQKALDIAIKIFLLLMLPVAILVGLIMEIFGPYIYEMDDTVN